MKATAEVKKQTTFVFKGFFYPGMPLREAAFLINYYLGYQKEGFSKTSTNLPDGMYLVKEQKRNSFLEAQGSKNNIFALANTNQEVFAFILDLELIQKLFTVKITTREHLYDFKRLFEEAYNINFSVDFIDLPQIIEPVGIMTQWLAKNQEKGYIIALNEDIKWAPNIQRMQMLERLAFAERFRQGVLKVIK